MTANTVELGATFLMGFALALALHSLYERRDLGEGVNRGWGG